jgi:hypothetical protein
VVYSFRQSEDCLPLVSIDCAKMGGTQQLGICLKGSAIFSVTSCYVAYKQQPTMYTTYHLSSAQEISTDILDAIKATFKSKPIVITVEEEMDTTSYLASTDANRAMLQQSIDQAKNGEFVEVKLNDL